MSVIAADASWPPVPIGFQPTTGRNWKQLRAHQRKVCKRGRYRCKVLGRYVPTYSDWPEVQEADDEEDHRVRAVNISVTRQNIREGLLAVFRSRGMHLYDPELQVGIPEDNEFDLYLHDDGDEIIAYVTSNGSIGCIRRA